MPASQCTAGAELCDIRPEAKTKSISKMLNGMGQEAERVTRGALVIWHLSLWI